MENQPTAKPKSLLQERIDKKIIVKIVDGELQGKLIRVKKYEIELEDDESRVYAIMKTAIVYIQDIE